MVPDIFIVVLVAQNRSTPRNRSLYHIAARLLGLAFVILVSSMLPSDHWRRYPPKTKERVDHVLRIKSGPESVSIRHSLVIERNAEHLCNFLVGTPGDSCSSGDRAVSDAALGNEAVKRRRPYNSSDIGHLLLQRSS